MRKEQPPLAAPTLIVSGVSNFYTYFISTTLRAWMDGPDVGAVRGSASRKKFMSLSVVDGEQLSPREEEEQGEGHEWEEEGVIDIVDASPGSASGEGDDPMELLGSDDSEEDLGDSPQLESSSGDDEDRELNSQRRSHMLSTMTFDTSVPGQHVAIAYALQCTM